MGDNIFLGDRNAVRTPMQWSADRNAGFSRANPQSLYLPITIDPEYHYEAVNVETQLGNPSSLLWWHRRIIALRKRYPAFGRGDLHMLECENYRVFAFVRRWQNEEILCVANLSRYAQHLELDLAECEGRVPVELFSQNEFPRIKHQPYGLTLGPHSFLWFSLEERPDSISPVVTAELPPVAELAYSGREQDLFRGNLKSAISEAIAVYCRGLEWVKSLHINSAALTLVDIIPIGNGDPEMVLLRVALDRGSPKAGVLMLPARMSKVESFAGIARSRGEILRLRNERSGESVHVVDASNDPAFAHALHKLLAGGRTIRSHMGRLSVRRNSGQRQDIDSTPESFQITRSDQGNLIVAYSRQLMGKFITRPQPGLHPDVEICKVLCPCTTEQHHVPNTLAWVEFLPEGSEQGETIGILQEYVPNLGSSDRWLSDHMERVVECATAARGAVVSIPKPKLSSVGDDAPPEWAPNMADLFRPVSELVESLGRHLAGLHLALSRAKDGGQFAPEPFTLLYQRSLYQSMRNHAASALKLLRSMKVRHDPVMEAKTRQLVQLRQHVDTCFKGVTGSRIRGQRIRIHGDLHLAQILFTGTDFVFLDFEGDASKPLSERRIKRSPLRDLATLLWSIRLIACRGLYVKDAHGWTLIDRHETLEPVTTAWAVTFCRALLKGYMSNPDIAGLLPEKPEEIRALLNAYMLERAFFDLEQVMARGAPEARVVLRALLQMIEYTA
jgi:maltose alpha-D-glucosyltransferase/alpha-amylase